MLTPDGVDQDSPCSFNWIFAASHLDPLDCVICTAGSIRFDFTSIPVDAVKLSKGRLYGLAFKREFDSFF